MVTFWVPLCSVTGVQKDWLSLGGIRGEKRGNIDICIICMYEQGSEKNTLIPNPPFWFPFDWFIYYFL